MCGILDSNTPYFGTLYGSSFINGARPPFSRKLFTGGSVPSGRRRGRGERHREGVGAAEQLHQGGVTMLTPSRFLLSLSSSSSSSSSLWEECVGTAAAANPNPFLRPQCQKWGGKPSHQQQQGAPGGVAASTHFPSQVGCMPRPIQPAKEIPIRAITFTANN